MHKLKQKLVDILAASPFKKSPEAEADLILYHFFREQTKTPGHIQITPEIEVAATEIARKRAQGVPLQQILGYQFFYEHEFQVSPHVLIPRPETEILVQSAIGWAKTNLAARFAELGLGSGAISTEILFACPDITGVATEISQDAIKIAEKNLQSILGPEEPRRLDIIHSKNGSLGFEEFRAYPPFDLIVSNPPYVAREDEIEAEVFQHEPHLALFPDSQDPARDPNFFYDNFLIHAPHILRRGGAAFFEIPHERAETIAKKFLNAGYQVLLIPDLTGRSRVLKCTD